MTMRSPLRRRDDGFALLAVLWVMVGVSVLAMAAQLAARESVAAATNRAELAAAAWRAEGCVERARAAVSAALRMARDEGPSAPTWNWLDRVVVESPLTAGCDLRMRAAGAALDANAADGETLRRFFAALGESTAAADSLADALLDWRDPDAEPRPSGAEREWYRAAGRRAPRDGPLADARELARVRGFERFAALDAPLAVEPGRVPLNQAPLPVLAALPGVGPEALARVEGMRFRGELVAEPAALAAGLSPAAEAEFLRNFPELSMLATAAPDAWVIVALAREGTPPVTAAHEVRLVRAGERAAVVRRRTWIQ